MKFLNINKHLTRKVIFKTIYSDSCMTLFSSIWDCFYGAFQFKRLFRVIISFTVLSETPAFIAGNEIASITAQKVAVPATVLVLKLVAVPTTTVITILGVPLAPIMLIVGGLVGTLVVGHSIIRLYGIYGTSVVPVVLVPAVSINTGASAVAHFNVGQINIGSPTARNPFDILQDYIITITRKNLPIDREEFVLSGMPANQIDACLYLLHRKRADWGGPQVDEELLAWASTELLVNGPAGLFGTVIAAVQVRNGLNAEETLALREAAEAAFQPAIAAAIAAGEAPVAAAMIAELAPIPSMYIVVAAVFIGVLIKVVFKVVFHR